MRRIIAVVAVAVLGFLAATAQDDFSQHIRDLQSRVRTTRWAAAETLAKLTPPTNKRGRETLMESALSFLGLEAAEMSIVAAPPKGPVTMIPVLGDELTLVRLKANARSYIGVSFILCGGLSIGDYYNYEYDNAEGTHFSLRLRELNHDATRTSQSAHLYVRREVGQALVERATRSEERGFKGSVVRVMGILEARRFREPSNSWDLIEVLDWQFLDHTGQAWEPWALQGLRHAFKLLSVSHDSEPYVRIVTNANSYGSAGIDSVVRNKAISALVALEGRHHRRALRRLEREYNRAERSGNKTVQKWIALAAQRINAK